MIHVAVSSPKEDPVNHFVSAWLQSVLGASQKAQSLSGFQDSVPHWPEPGRDSEIIKVTLPYMRRWQCNERDSGGNRVPPIKLQETSEPVFFYVLERACEFSRLFYMC